MNRTEIANQSLGRLTGGIAHDLNNVLAAIVGFANLLALGKQADDPQLADLKQILAAAERGAKLTRQLLVWSRQQVMTPRPVGLPRFISERAEIWGRMLPVPLSIELVDSDRLGAVRMDPSELDLVLLTIIADACHRNLEGADLELRVLASVLDAADASAHDVLPGGYARLEFRHPTRIALPGDWRTTQTYELGASYQVIKQLGGDLWIEDDGTADSLLVLLLPMSGAQPAAGRPTLLQPGTILLVDDDDAVRAAIARLLRFSGFAVIEAANAGEALILSEDATLDIRLLLTDVRMPRVDGLHLAERLRRNQPTLRVIYMTGHDPEGGSRSPVAAAPWLQKPLSRELLLAAITAELTVGAP